MSANQDHSAFDDTSPITRQEHAPRPLTPNTRRSAFPYNHGGSRAPLSSTLERVSEHRIRSSSSTNSYSSSQPTPRSSSSSSSPSTMSKPIPAVRPIRTIPRSRHFRSSSPDEPSDKDSSHRLPYKVTAQGFPVNNKVKKAKYATSVDDRGYLTVYEYALNDQTIMWDYVSGFVHLTGIWKALGNNKADIVRLVENHPELEGVIRRIRGGFLKIQGTWVPYDLCRKLALRTCHPIRHALISVFGPDFPDECLKPGTKGYGTLTLDDSGLDKKRKKRKNSGKENEACERPSVMPGAMSEREKRPRLAHAAGLTRPASACSDASSDSLGSSPSLATQSKTSPPTLPRIVDLANNGFYPSKVELLDLLRASRSLQKLSAGAADDWADEGGAFHIAGGSATFVWDGSDALEILEPEAFTTMDQAVTSWDTPPQMVRKYSSATQGSSLGGYPITPPQQYPLLHDAEVERLPPLEAGIPDVRCTTHSMVVSGKLPSQAAHFRAGGVDILHHHQW